MIGDGRNLSQVLADVERNRDAWRAEALFLRGLISGEQPEPDAPKDAR